jgi:hypothetical protein
MGRLQQSSVMRVVPASAALLGACTVLAPSDDELMGDAHQEPMQLDGGADSSPADGAGKSGPDGGNVVADGGACDANSASCGGSCTAGYEDCNGDLSLGASGNGCETHTAEDVTNCGACGAPCAGKDQNAVFCKDSTCKRYSVTIASGTTGPVRGGSGGVAFDMPCAKNEVVMGIRGIMATNSINGLGANCARLDIRPNGTSYLVDVVPTSSLPVVGAGFSTGAETTFTLPCPPSMVVTAIRGATWPPWKDSRICVKQLTLTCTEVQIDASRKILLGPSASDISVGQQDSTSTAFPKDTCGTSGLLIGFSGRGGSLVDALSVKCGALAVGAQNQRKTSDGWVAE